MSIRKELHLKIYLISQEIKFVLKLKGGKDMKKTIIAVMIFLQSAIFSQSLPVFLKADSLRVSKILRAQGDTSVQTDFIQQLQLSCVETAIVVYRSNKMYHRNSLPAKTR